ncbi:MAG: hypothetical protein WDO24_12125 [Pseudomonadota bacterium]
MVSAGSWDSTVAPISQNQARPRIGRNRSRRAATRTHQAPAVADDIDLDRQIGRGRRRGRNISARPIAEHRQNDQGDRHQQRAVGAEHQRAGGDLAEQDREKRTGLDQRIARDQLVRRQMNRQDAVFQRAEERRMQPHQDQHDEQQGDIAEAQPDHAEQHEADLASLDDADQPSLLEPVGEPPGRRRAQQERQDEQAGRQIGEDGAVHPGLRRQAEHDQDHHRGLEQIVVERAEELSDEHRQEASARQQRHCAAARLGALDCRLEGHRPDLRDSARPD